MGDVPMKIMFITQKVDRNDAVLGVYHEWIRSLAQKADSVEAICLYKGDHDLPHNVTVHSLGKEKGESRLKYVKNFFKYIVSLNKKYDIVFVHMNAIYVPLGWLFWKLMGKKIFFWYAGYKVANLARFALLLSNKGVTSIPGAFIKSSKVVVTGQGIDADLFRRDEKVTKKQNSILFLGRISPVKNLEVLVDALRKMDINFKAQIVGSSPKRDREYYSKIKNLAADLVEKGKLEFIEQVPNHKTPEFYNSNKLFINLTDSGSFDKSILEAMACEMVILVSNNTYREILPEELQESLMFKEKNSEDLADKIKKIFVLDDTEYKSIAVKLRKIVEDNHSLDGLTNKLIKIFKA
jgi:glycosyltransferase involved in cell wall biosynthesis